MKPYLKQLLELSKLRLCLLNSFVVGASYSMGIPIPDMACLSPLAKMVAGSLALSVSTQIKNQIDERPFDALMKRTCNRPLLRSFDLQHARIWCATTGVSGILLLASQSYLSALIGSLIWVLYIRLYTPMKRTSTLNTYWGALIGGLPVYVGWAATGQSLLALAPFAFFLFMVTWQIQHFFGIRWIYFQDYNDGGFKMESEREIAGAMIAGLIPVTFMVLAIYFNPACSFTSALATGIAATSLFKFGFKPAIAFSKGECSAEELKKKSYFFFLPVPSASI